MGCVFGGEVGGKVYFFEKKCVFGVDKWVELGIFGSCRVQSHCTDNLRIRGVEDTAHFCARPFCI